MEGISTLSGLSRRAGAPMSPILRSTPSLTQNEVLWNFFKSLLDPKDHAASSGAATASASGKQPTMEPARTSSETRNAGGGASASGEPMMRAVGRKMGRMLDVSLLFFDIGCPLQ
jgi:hypothetical protein